jgi:molybdopterin converting factor small subunit
MPTKAELEEQLKELQKEKEELEKTVGVLTDQLKAEIKDKEGWLVTTPNPLHNGEMWGIQFVNGQAFIPKKRKFPRFEVEPQKELTLQRQGLTEEQIKQVRERESMPTAQRCVQRLEHDFGYTVEYYTAEDQDALNAAVEERVRERAQMKQMQENAEREKALMPPGI